MYRIKDWEQYQARTDARNTSWVKWHVTMLLDKAYMELPVEIRWQWSHILNMSRDHDGLIHLSDDEIGFRLGVQNWSPEPFIPGLLEPVQESSNPDQCSDMVQFESYRPLRRRKIREDKIREDREPENGESEVQFPLRADQTPATWSPEPEFLAQLRLAYPDIHVKDELHRMLVWLQANPSRRKTAKGMPRFINGWLSKESVYGQKPISQLRGD